MFSVLTLGYLTFFFLNNSKCSSAKEEILLFSVTFVQICKNLFHFYGSHLIPTPASPCLPVYYLPDLS